MSEFPQGSVQSEVLSTTRQEFEAARSEIYFVDSSVPGAEALALSLGEGSNVYMINATGDALGQIAAALDGQSVDAVHIYSHGKDGAIYLGGEWIDEAALNTAEATLNRIGQSLNAGGDILLYGCNTAAGSLGESFIQRMARMASANVAASSDITGNGGDWELEASAGVVDSGVKTPEGWSGSLADKISWGTIEGSDTKASSLTGFASDDSLYNYYDGSENSTDVDTMAGDLGNDAYYIKGGAVTITEKANQGLDSVFSHVKSFTLTDSAHVEYIKLEAQEGFVGQNAIGNELAQIIEGNALSNNLTGGGGGDELYGYDGNDYLDGGDGSVTNTTAPEKASTLVGGKGDDNYIVRHADDVVIENRNEGTDHVFTFVNGYKLGANVEKLTLLEGATTGYGNELNNELHGNAATSMLAGGKGNDSYYITYAATKIVEDKNAGTDAVYVNFETDTAYKLGDNIENLFLEGSATKATGNDLNNRIEGNATKGSILDGGKGNDTLVGGTGNDVFKLDSAKDVVIDKEGDNTIISTATVNLNSFKEAIIKEVRLDDTGNINATGHKAYKNILIGNAGSNVLTGGDLADTLADGVASGDTLGGATGGTDKLVGGKGDDHYIIYNNATTVVEAANAGFDSVTAHVDYTLAANVENLTLETGAKVGTGNNLSNTITGHDSGVILHGGANAAGLAGDTLIGGSGADQFYSYNANDKAQDSLIVKKEKSSYREPRRVQ